MKRIANINPTSILAYQICQQVNSVTCKDDYDFTKMRIGLEITLNNITKFMIICGLSILFKIWIESVIVFIAFAFLRKHTYGLHAKSNVVCTLIMCVTHILTPIVVKDLHIRKSIILLLFCIFIYGLYKYAPSDTEKLPLLNKSKRILLKRKSVINGFFIMIIALIIPFNNISNVLLISMMYVVIMVLPITYKIAKERRNNYAYYE